jgi:hypothetical protein
MVTFLLDIFFCRIIYRKKKEIKEAFVVHFCLFEDVLNLYPRAQEFFHSVD